MNTPLPMQAARTAAALFGAGALLAIAYFEAKTDSLSAFGAMTLVPYVSFAFVMSIAGSRISAWYLPQTGYFEAIAVPVILPLGAAIVAGVAFAASIIFLEDPGTGTPVLPLREVFVFGLFAAFLFLYTAWPVLLPAMALTSFILRRRFSNGYAHGSV